MSDIKLSGRFAVRRTVLPYNFPNTTLIPARAYTRFPTVGSPGLSSQQNPGTPQEAKFAGRVLMTSITGQTPGGFVTGYGGNPLTDDWADSSIGISAVWKGYGWEHFKQLLLAEGYTGFTENGEKILFTGTTAMRFMSLHHEVILIHGAPLRVLQRIQQMSNVGTVFRMWFTSDRISTGPLYSDYAEPFRLIGKTYLMAGSSWSDGTYTHTEVDSEWPNSWPSGIVRHPTLTPPGQSPRPGETSGHSWFIDLRSSTYKSAIAAEMTSRWSYWGAIPGLVVGYHQDNASPQFIAGNANNEPSISEATWTAAQQALSTACEAALAGQGLAYPFSANVGDQGNVAKMSNVREQYWEHPFLTGDGAGYWDIAVTLSKLDIAASQGTKVLLGGRVQDSNPQHIDQWIEADHDHLRQIVERAESNGMLDRLFTITHASGDLNSTLGGYIYHGPTMPDLV